MRYESIRGELSLPALQELGQNCFGIPEKGAEWAFDPAQYFNSADVGPFSISGSSWALTFDTPGTFSYFCVFHRELGMEGTIIVQQREARSQ